MAQIAIGKELPNLKITLGNDYKNNEILEDGEILDEDLPEKNECPTESDKKPITINRTFSSPLEEFRKYENIGGGFITGLDLSSEAVTKKLEERAERFGVIEFRKNPVTQAEINALYESLEINVENNSSAKSKNIRLDSIHMRGVEEMSTNDIFAYFKEYGPASVEWINDYSCNVVWLDETGAARALLGLSRVLVIQKKPKVSDEQNKSTEVEDKTENEQVQSTVEQTLDEKTPEIEEVIIMSDFESDDDEEDNDISLKHQNKTNDKVDEMEVDSAPSEPKNDNIEPKNDVNVPVPPGHWRLGVPHTKAKAILLRFASKDDKKLPGAEKRSQYYQKYGNPNYGGMRGLITATRKRKINATRSKIGAQHVSHKIDSATKLDEFPVYMHNPEKTKRVRMRMYADDEEERLLKRAKRRHRSREKSKNIHDRLGKSTITVHAIVSKSDSEKEEEVEKIAVSSSVSIPSKLPSRYNVWTRLAQSMADESDDISQENDRRHFPSKDLRNKLNSIPMHERKSNDLRSKLNRKHKGSHRSPLIVDAEDETNSD